MSNTIILKAELDRRYEEKYADAAITPGMILETQSDGEWAKHSVSGGVWDRSVAIEDALSGPDGVNTRGNTIDDAYATGDLVRGHYLEPGDIFNGLLAAGETVVKGGPLSSNGDGTLQARTGTEEIVGWADDAVNNSAGITAARVPVIVK